jgi:sugar phosphate isomerase/epimerase
MDARVLGNYDELKLFIGHLNRAGKQLMEEGGIHLSYHNHAVDFSKINGETILQQIVDGTDERFVFFEPDTHWLQAGGVDVLAWLEKCKGRMQYLHVKDYRVGSINYDTVVETHDKRFSQIGGGNLPWQEIVDTALACGVKAFIVEQDDTYGQDPYECVAQSYATLKACGL